MVRGLKQQEKEWDLKQEKKIEATEISGPALSSFDDVL